MLVFDFIFYFLSMGVRETFRQNLIYYRKKAGLTQEQLSEKCELNLNYIASMECISSRFPKPETIDAIATALNILPSDLFLEKGCPKNAITFESDDFMKEIIDEFSDRFLKEMKDFFTSKLN